MTQQTDIKYFEGQQIRTVWDADGESLYFSIVDVVQVLTEQSTVRGASTYWAVLKKRIKENKGDELLTNCKQLKLPAADGKYYKSDVAAPEQLLEILQSIPSPKVETYFHVGGGNVDVTVTGRNSIFEPIVSRPKRGRWRNG